MSSPFVAQLRSRRAPIVIGNGGAGTITIRVEASDIWETVRVTALPDTPLSEVKQKVVAALFSPTEPVDDFVLKLRGWEMLDHNEPLGAAGVVDGSILLLAYRRRRPVR